MKTQGNDRKASHARTLEKEWVTEFSRLQQVAWLSSSLLRQRGKNNGLCQHSKCIKSLRGSRSSLGDITFFSKYTVLNICSRLVAGPPWTPLSTDVHILHIQNSTVIGM